MREIKFRAWDKENNKWVEAQSGGQSLVDGKLQFTYHRDLSLQDWEVFRNIGAFPANYELMQSTGLKDKNGVLIYEGDVVKFQMTRTVLVDHPVIVATTDETAIYQGIVKWGEFGWRPFTDGKVEEVEVIGNIYENKDLLV